MELYIFTFIFLLIISFVNFSARKSLYKFHKILLIIIAALLILISGTRMVGFDYDQYVDMYDTISLKDRYYGIYQIELGYSLLTSIFKFLSLPFHAFLICLSSFLVISRLTFFNRLSPFPFLSIVLYFPALFLVTDMGQIRNALAYSITMFAYLYYINDNKKQAYFMILLACVFHNSAFILIPSFIILAYVKNISFKYAFSIFLMLLPLVIIDIRVYFELILPYMPPDLALKFSAYIFSTSFGQQLGLNTSFILRVSIFILLFYYRKKGENDIPYYNFLLMAYSIGLFIFMTFNSVQEFAIRFGNYFKFLELIILPIFVSLTKDKILKILMYILVISYAIWSFYKLLYNPLESHYYIPYKSILF